MRRASSGRPALPTAGSTSASSWPGGGIPRKPSPLMRNQRGRKTARRRLRCPVPRRRISVVIEKVGNLAGALATTVGQSRRAFLSGLGQGALAVGAVLGGISTAAAGSGGNGVRCCYYRNNRRPYDRFTDCNTADVNCP